MNSNMYVAESERESRLNAEVPGETLAPPKRTRLLYDLVAPLYPISSRLFHAHAHAKTVDMLNIRNGSSVLEVAMGSGEMFDRLVRANPGGQTIGVDFSANMAVQSQAKIRQTYVGANAHCPCTDARQLPFQDASFDVLVCCYLFELLSEEHMLEAMDEMCRVLKPGGRLGLILVAQNASSFNLLYNFCTFIAPAFWGRQVSSVMPELLESRDFEIETATKIRQLYFHSRILIARKLV
ncbi:MAG: class I SAM-dependent methyltransferase [Bryobacteraceae bacterium]